MGPYNGWTGYERTKSHKLWLAAVARGAYRPPAGPCELCGNPVQMQHREDYNRLESHAVCIECHMRIHARFRFPNTWIRYVIALRAGHRPPIWRSVEQYLAAHRGQVDEPLTLGESLGWDVGSQWWAKLGTKRVDLKAKLYGGTFQEELIKR